jgi:hypothetical protein
MPITMIILSWLLKLILIVTVVLYSGMVLTNYAVRGSDYCIHFNFGEFGWSIEQVLVWCGVRLLGGTVRTVRAIWELLIQASADVGQWFISKGSKRVQEEFRSRFL